MSATVKIIFGIAMVLGGLWGSAYIVGFFGRQHWAAFPAIATGVLMIFAGICLVSFGGNDSQKGLK
jgi:uncharacterized membrane protein YcjF (UPF0283 family)